MIPKEKILSAINEMPSEVNIEELIERLIFMEKVEIGLEQVKEGKGKEQAEVRKQFEEWLK